MRNPVNRAAAVTIFLLALMMLLGTGWASGTEADPESVPTVCIDNVHGNLNERIEKTEPTCENPGKEEMVVFCIDCGTEIAREVIRQWDATGHSWGEWTVTGQVTCEADGSETRRCLHDADHAETRTIPATGHSWGEWTVSRPAA